MRKHILLFVAGLALLNFMTSLPDMLGLVATLAVASVIGLRFRYLLPLPFICLGIAWGVYSANVRLDQRLDDQWEGIELRISGVVSNIPKHEQRKTSFLFDPLKICKKARLAIRFPEGAKECASNPKKIRLSWYSDQAKQLKAGDYWQFDVKLRRPNGFSNPGGFDYEKWLFARNIGGTGYVVKSAENLQLSAKFASSAPTLIKLVAAINRSRQSIADFIDRSHHSYHAKAFLKALAIGDRSGLDSEHFEVLAFTGTSHLVAVSGLHISLVSGFVYFVVRIGFRYASLINRYITAQKFAIVSSLLVATIYSALAGFTLPTVRAWIMLMCFAAGLLSESNRSAWDSYFTSLLLVCLLQPLAVLETGFWLSFIAVGVILFSITGRIKKSNSVGNNGNTIKEGRLFSFVNNVALAWRVQLGIFLGLLPLLIIFYAQVPWLAPLINLVVVPFVAWLVVPLTLLGVLISVYGSTASNTFLELASGAIDLMWALLRWLAQIDGLVLPVSSFDSSLAIGLLILFCGVLLLPKNLPFRYLSVVLSLSLILTELGQTRLPGALSFKTNSNLGTSPGGLSFTILDVGQGLAAVLETAEHTLVYDTGPKLGTNLDGAKAAIIPYLRHKGRTHVDYLVVSHDDIDHTGGAQSLIDKHPVNTLIAWPGTVNRINKSNGDQILRINNCIDPQIWKWDGVNFALFSLLSFGVSVNSDNNHSCMLKAWGEGFSVLIPGDIEKSAEYRLVKNYQLHATYQCLAFDLDADILVAPHHGSKSSSASLFVREINPKQVIYSSAFRSRFGHPHSEVIERYASLGISAFYTAYGGALIYRLPADNDMTSPIQHRVESGRFWHRSI